MGEIMADIPGLPADVYFGDVGNPLPAFPPLGASDEDTEDQPLSDDERDSLIAVLGFDPREIDDEPVTNTGNPNHDEKGRFASSGNGTSVSRNETCNKAISTLFNMELNDKQIAELVGAKEGSTIQIHGNDNHNVLTIYTLHADYESHRRIYRDGQRLLVCGNVSFDVRKEAQGKGIGTKILFDQVAGLSKLGVDRIETVGTKGSDQNGYYTWPRLGYDTNLKESVMERLPSHLSECTTLADLMKSKEGREWWKTNGKATHMEFDLAENSLSRQILSTYVKAKEAKHE
jgi:GNAT superfamily N-acetyltransferase